MNETGRTLKEILKEHAQAKGLNAEKLRQQTGVAERYLAALLEGEYEKLPAAPYVRGYLAKLGLLLELDPNELWELFQREGKLKSSGPEDRMPSNRFALRRVNRGRAAAAVGGILVAAYLLLNANRLLGRPEITVASPEQATIVATAQAITIVGEINPRDILKIDGEEVPVDREGRFSKEYFLAPGLNSIMITAENPIGGRKSEVVRRVIYQPEGK